MPCIKSQRLQGQGYASSAPCRRVASCYLRLRLEPTARGRCGRRAGRGAGGVRVRAAGSEREASLVGQQREPSRDCRAGRAGDAAPPGQAVAGLRPERTRRAGGPWRWWTRPKRCSASSKVRDCGDGWATSLLRWDMPADLPEDRTPMGLPPCKDPQKACFGQELYSRPARAK